MAISRVLAGLLFAAACVQVWAGLHLQGLAGDGAGCLREMLSSGRPACLEPARWVTQLGLEAPTLLARRVLGVVDTATLAIIYSLSLQLAPLVLTALTFAVVPPARHDFILFPVISYFAGVSSVVSFGLIEGPTAAFCFWLIFYRVLFMPEGIGAWLLTLMLAVPALFLHEVFSFLGLLLAVACWWRGGDTDSAGFRRRMRALAVWFLLVAVVQTAHVIWPRDFTNRDGYVHGLLWLRWLIQPETGGNTALLLDLLATATILAVWRWQHAATGIVTAFAVAAFVIAAGAWLSPWLRAPSPLFYARNHPAIVSVPLALLAMMALASRGAWRTLSGAPSGLLRHGLAVLALLASATLAEQLALTQDWSSFVRSFAEWTHFVPNKAPAPVGQYQ